VIAPTRELVVQIEENARAYGRHVPMRMATVYGGVGERPQIEALRSGADIVIATPGRLLDLTGRRYGDFSKIEFLVLDEADRMLDMGFLPQIRQVVRGLPVERQTMLFSATLSPEIEAITREFLRHPKIVQIGRRANPAETVAQFVYEVPRHLKPALLAHLLKDEHLDMVLVFTRTKHGADRVARKLTQSRVPSATLHSNKSQAQRLRALKDFKSGAARVLVATDIAARGLDIDEVSHVINLDLPHEPEVYVHRIGRTARAGASGVAISFCSVDERPLLKDIERTIRRTIDRDERLPVPVEAPRPEASPRPQPVARPSAKPRDTAPTRRPAGQADAGREALPAKGGAEESRGEGEGIARRRRRRRGRGRGPGGGPGAPAPTGR